MNIADLIKKYSINIEKLEEEQIKLSKLIQVKDSIDFSQASKIAGMDCTFFKNQIIAACIILYEGEIIYQEYVQQKIKFPYIPGFRAYRELPALLDAYSKLEEKPDVIIIPGNGIAHPRLGLASHFSLAADNIPTIGLSNSVMGCEIQDKNILKNRKIVGKVLQTKPGSKPIYMSPGNNISIASAEVLVLKYTTPPHKLPEPLRLASKYAKKIASELMEKPFSQEEI